MDQSTWYRLDNIGKFYAAQAGSSAQTVFRCSATLADDIDADILQHALDQTVDTFPNFNVCLRSGMFWHYLERSTKPPAVTQENLPICFGLHVDTKSILFRVSYYRARINLEVSHMVADGRGALSFFRTLLGCYIQERYALGELPNSYGGSDNQKVENSFDKYFEKDKAESAHAPSVYRLTGWRDASDPTFIEYHVSTRQVLDLAHSCNVSLTSLISAAAMCAIRSDMPRRDRRRAIRFDVPVDLRRFFESSTTKNFFGLAYVTLVPGDDDKPLESVAQHVQAQLTAATQTDALKARMNHMVALEKNMLLRYLPMFFKDFVLHLANNAETRRTTATVSNLGAFNIDEETARYLRDVNIITSTTGLSIMLCSFGDDLSISISSIYANRDTVKNFCRIFAERGIEGRININRSNERRIVEAAPRRTKEARTR